nr:MAG TPA: hypothetical protein [Caudoviricetes sp.]
MEPPGGIEPHDFHPTLLCHRFRRPMWGQGTISRQNIATNP